MYDVSEGEETQLYSYLPTSFHDWLLIDLWGKMQRSGDLQKTMLSGSQTLLEFCQVLRRPDTYFSYDQEGPYFAAWCEPVMCGISLGFWIREDKRKSRICLTLAHTLIQKLFERYPVIVVITKDEETKRFHEHFGFQFCGDIPLIYDGHTAYISYLTQAAYTEKHHLQDPQTSHKDPEPESGWLPFLSNLMRG